MNKRFSKKHALALNLNLLTFASTQILLFTLFPYLAETLSISISVIIGSFALGTLLFIWGAPFWSSQVNKLGEFKVMTYGLLGLSVSFSLLALLINFTSFLNTTLVAAILIFSRIIYGMMASSIVPVAQTTRSQMYTNEENLKGMFTHSLFLNIGRAVGPIFVLLSGNSIDKLMLLLALWSFLLVLLNWQLSDSVPNTAITERPQAKNWKASLNEIRTPLFITVFLTIFVGVLHSSLGEIIKLSLNLPSLAATQTMAKLLLMGSLAMVIVQITGKNLQSISWKKTITLGSLILSMGAAILIFMNHEYQAWIAIMLISVGIAIIHPSNLSMLKDLSHARDYPKNAGILASSNTIGYAIGGGLSALIIGSHLPILVLVTAFILTLFILTMSGKKVQNA